MFAYAPLTALEIHQAIPATSRRARGQRDWLDALARDPELSALRPAFQRSILAAARVLMRFASWADKTTRPTRARICELARFSVSTWKRCRAWLEDHGYLATVRHGWTATVPSQTRPAVLDDAPNEAAVYVLCVPRPRKNTRREPVTAGQAQTEPLTLNRRLRVLSPARELPRTTAADDGTPAFVVTYLRSQIAELRRGPGKNLTDRAVLAIARPFMAARWSPADLAWAIGHDPVTGKAHRTSILGVRQPASWLAWRLTRWCHDPDQEWKSWHTCGRWDHQAWPQVGPSRTEQVLAAAAADRAARETIPLTPGSGADPRPFADRVRQQLGWRTSPRKEVPHDDSAAAAHDDHGHERGDRPAAGSAAG